MASEAKFKTVLPDNSINAIVDYTGESDVYQSKTNYSGPAEFVHYAKDIEFGLPSKDFGQRTTIHIPPSYRLIKNIVLEVRLTGIWNSADMVALHLIKEFGYRVPGCERMIMRGDCLLFKPMLEAKTIERRKLVCGVLGNRAGGTEDTVLDVYCLLPMPWNNMDPSKTTFPYPAHLTTSSLELDFLFRNKTEVTSNASLTINSATLRFEYGTLSNEQLYKSSVYKYNFDARYHDVYTTVGGEHTTSVRLTGIRNGEMNQLNFFIREVAADSENGIINRYHGLDIRNLKLTYAGQTIWNSVGKTQDLWDIIEDADDGKRVPISANEATVCRIFTVPIANILENMRKNGYSLGADFKDSDLKLTFDKPGKLAADWEKQYEVVTEYLLTSLYQFDGQSAKLIQ